jgi:very-short-patch-repair endonuclease
VVSRRQLAEHGVSRHHIRRQLEAQRWRSIGSRIICLHTGGLARPAQLWAALLHSGPHSVIGGLTSLEHLGLRGWARDLVHVLVPMGVNVPDLAGVVVHRTRIQFDPVSPPAASSLRCTGAARSTIDAARWGSRPRTAAALVLAAVQQRIVTSEELARCAGEFEWLRNSSSILDAIVEAMGGADSWAEVETARLVQQVGLPRPRRQFVVVTPDGPRRVDLAVDLPDGTLLVLEVDGPHHLDPVVRRDDAVKDAALIAAGHAVLRIPVAMVRSDRARVRAQLEAIVRAAGRRDSRNAS